MRHSLCLLGIFVAFRDVAGSDYPFDLPAEVSATLSVDTSKKEAFKNPLLGYNIEWFETEKEKNFIRRFNPVSIRFPHGVFANFYKWQTDGYQNDSYDNKQHETTIDTYARAIKGHINEIASLNAEKEAIFGRGFHMMWTYSMNFDDAESCVARAEKDAGLGLEIRDIELGNEHFWKTQRSNQTATEAQFYNRARSVAEALRERFPEVRVSIPLGWRRTQENYNRAIMGDTTYYDAISIHRYMGADPDVPGESDTAYSTILTSRLTLKTDVDWVRSYAGEKPIWLSEWAVSAGDGAEVDAAACLAMADVYLFMSENQDVYDRANWFIFNKMANPMVLVGPDRRPIYPLQRRGYLSTYEILHEVFMDSAMLDSAVVSTSLNGQMNAVNARMVEKEGVYRVIAINLADKPADFTLELDSGTYVGGFVHRALVFGELGPVENLDIDVDPTVLIKEGTGLMTLPPLSVNMIELDTPAPMEVELRWKESGDRRALEFEAHPHVTYQFEKLARPGEWKAIGEPITVTQSVPDFLWELPSELGIETFESMEGLYRLVGTRWEPVTVPWE